MANFLVWDIPEEALNRLKKMAKVRNWSLQQELRAVLENMVCQTLPDVYQKASELRKELLHESSARAYSEG